MGALEALLFASPRPLSASELADATGVDENQIVRVLMEMEADLKSRDDRGLELQRVAGGYRLVTKGIYDELIRTLHTTTIDAPLSQAALETVAIIAYEQPVTRAEIEDIRGVQCGSTLNTLVERGLIAEAGRREAPGRPILYVTTPRFLEELGLDSIEELPELPELDMLRQVR